MTTADDFDLTSALADIQATWGGRLRQARKAARMTQADLADAAGVDQVSISKYETGHAYPTDRRLPLAHALGVSNPYDLFPFPEIPGVPAPTPEELEASRAAMGPCRCYPCRIKIGDEEPRLRGHRPRVARQRKAALTFMARLTDRFTIDHVWKSCPGTDYLTVQQLTLELRQEGSLIVDNQPGEAKKPVIMRWADD